MEHTFVPTALRITQKMRTRRGLTFIEHAEQRHPNPKVLKPERCQTSPTPTRLIPTSFPSGSGSASRPPCSERMDSGVPPGVHCPQRRDGGGPPPQALGTGPQDRADSRLSEAPGLGPPLSAPPGSARVRWASPTLWPVCDELEAEGAGSGRRAES